MNIEAYISEIKLQVAAGGVLALEIGDDVIASAVNSALREVQRYIDTTKFITIPYNGCISMKEYNAYNVARVYRSVGYGVAGVSSGNNPTGWSDPMYLAQWQTLAGNGNVYNLNNYTYNYAAWNTALQIRNTLSTDLAFVYDQSEQNLYINIGFDRPDYITIEYIPRYNNVDEVTSDFWIDIILRMSVALVKIILGRARTRMTQSGALYTQDGELLLNEGNEELNNIREQLRESTNLFYPVD